LKSDLSQAVIFCGGLGTRLKPLTDHIPKPMVRCCGRPFLEILIEQLRRQGISHILLLTGYLGERISSHFGDGSLFGLSIRYSHGPVDWDTGRRLWEARNSLDNKFLLMYSDNFAVFSLNNLIDKHNHSGKAVTLTLSKKSPGNFKLDNAGNIVTYDIHRGSNLEFVEIGYMLVDRQLVLDSYNSIDCNFNSILHNLTSKNAINSVVNKDMYYSISDPVRKQLADDYLSQKKILLIDRDGVINKKAPRGEYVTAWSEFEFIPETIIQMENLSTFGFEFIVITNQAGIARGSMSLRNLEIIHSNMCDYFKERGINILDIYICPHHWDDNCDCRKPKPGMFLKASWDYKFRLDETFFVGDDERDMEAANLAGTQGILFDEDHDFNFSDRIMESFKKN